VGSNTAVSAELLREYVIMARSRLWAVGRFLYGLLLFFLFIGLSIDTWAQTERVEIEQSLMVLFGEPLTTAKSPSDVKAFLADNLGALLETTNKDSGAIYLDGGRSMVTHGKVEALYGKSTGTCTLSSMTQKASPHNLNLNDYFSVINDTCISEQRSHLLHLSIDSMAYQIMSAEYTNTSVQEATEEIACRQYEAQEGTQGRSLVSTVDNNIGWQLYRALLSEGAASEGLSNSSAASAGRRRLATSAKSTASSGSSSSTIVTAASSVATSRAIASNLRGLFDGLERQQECGTNGLLQYTFWISIANPNRDTHGQFKATIGISPGARIATPLAPCRTYVLHLPDVSLLAFPPCSHVPAVSFLPALTYLLSPSSRSFHRRQDLHGIPD
jgi:hypothetical protein